MQAAEEHECLNPGLGRDCPIDNAVTAASLHSLLAPTAAHINVALCRSYQAVIASGTSGSKPVHVRSHKLWC